MWGRRPISCFPTGIPIYPSDSYWKDHHLPPQLFPYNTCHISGAYICMGQFGGSSNLFHCTIYIFLCQYYTILITIAYNDSWNLVEWCTPTSLLVGQVFLPLCSSSSVSWLSRSFAFPCKFSNEPVLSHKNTCSNFYWDCTESNINLGKNDTFTWFIHRSLWFYKWYIFFKFYFLTISYSQKEKWFQYIDFVPGNFDKSFY